MDQQPNSQPGQSTKQPSHLPLAIIPVILSGLIFGLLGYWYGQNAGPQQTATTASPTSIATTSPVAIASPNLTPTSTATPDPTAGWKTYTDSTYKVSFKYPTSWGTPQISQVVKGEDNEPVFDINTTILSLPAANPHGMATWVDITKLADYASTSKSSQATMLKNVYSSKSASGVTGNLWLPPSNAAIVASTPAVYIENADSSWRGLYYYATIGQSDLDSNSTTKRLFDSVMILTNNTTVLQLEFSTQPDMPVDISKDTSGYATATPCAFSSVLDSNAKQCKVKQSLIDTFNSTLKYFAGSITTL